MSIVVKLNGGGSYYLKFFPIKFQDKILKIVKVTKKNVNRLVFFGHLYFLDI